MTDCHWSFCHIGHNFDDTEKILSPPELGVKFGNKSHVSSRRKNFKVRRLFKSNLYKMKSSRMFRRKKLQRRECSDNDTDVNVSQLVIPNVRRSTRTTIVKQQQSKILAINRALASNDEPGLKKVWTPEKGRGVISTRSFNKGDFLVSYRGELITKKDALQRLSFYEKTAAGSYMYYFDFQSKTYCIDATPESSYLGRLVNHSYRYPNVITKVHVDAAGKPHIILVAKHWIDVGVELLYNYGENRKRILDMNPWLKNT